MNLYLILIILLLVGALISTNFTSPKKFYIIWCTFFFVISVTLKSAYYGLSNGSEVDTLHYVEMYKDVFDMSFAQVWDSFIERYIRGIGDTDIGYLLIEWFFSRVTTSYHVFSTFMDMLFFVPFAKIVNKYCDEIIEILFAYLLYLALFHYFAMYGARQFYAMGFGLMFFLNYSEKNYKKAFVFLFIGVLIHMSLLLVLIPFAFSFLQGKGIKTLQIVFLLSIPAIILFVNPIISFMGNFLGNERYLYYGDGDVHGGAITYIVLSELLSLACLIMLKDEMFDNDNFKYIYAMVPVFTFFAPLIYSNGSMVRITAYSQIFVTVLIPYLCKRRYENNYKLYLTIAIIALTFLTLKGDYQPYHFFWESDPVNLW